MKTKTILGMIISFCIGAFVMTLILDRALQIHVTHTLDVPLKKKVAP